MWTKYLMQNWSDDHKFEQKFQKIAVISFNTIVYEDVGH